MKRPICSWPIHHAAVEATNPRSVHWRRNPLLISRKHGTGEGYVASRTKFRRCCTQSQSMEIPAQIAGCHDATRH